MGNALMKSAIAAVTIVLVAVLMGCSVPTTPESTESLIVEITNQQATIEPTTGIGIPVTPTATRTSQQIDTLTPTEKPPLPTPSPDDWKIGLDFLFDESVQPPDCVLPCWMGLVPGSSSRDEVNDMFSALYGFDNPPGYFAYSMDYSFVADITQSNYRWVAGSLFGVFDISAWLHDRNNVLQALSFSWASHEINAQLSPATVVRSLGVPMDIFMTTSITAESHSEIGLDIVIIYSQGLIFQYYTHMLADVTYGADGDILNIEAPVCFEGANWTESPEIILASNVYLTEPIGDIDGELSPLHDYILHRNFLIQDMKPLIEITDMNMTTIVGLIRAGNCIEVNLAEVHQ
jgi:hypothetical protein